MPTNLTGQDISATYPQVLHVDGGPDATEKIVYGGSGVATSLKISTLGIAVGSIKLAGNAVTTSSGTLTLGAGVAFADAPAARIALGLGSVAEQSAGAVDITGGSLSGVTVVAAGGDVPFSIVTGRAYAAFSSSADQTGNTSAETAVILDTADVVGTGVSLTSDGSNTTRLVFGNTGVYRVTARLRYSNSDGSARTVTTWFSKNTTAVTRSANIVTVPASGTTTTETTIVVSAATNEYVRVMWMPSNVAVTLDSAAASSPVPIIPSAYVAVERIV